MTKLLFLFLLLPTLCFGQVATKVDILSTSVIKMGVAEVGKVQDEARFVPNKLVSVDTSGAEVKTYIEPKIEITRWQGEETLTLEIPSDVGYTDKTVDSVTGEVKMSNAKEGFYFRQHDADTLKFGLILNEIPDKSKVVSIDGVEYYQWSFYLKNWETFNFAYQEIWKEYKEVELNKEIYLERIDEDGRHLFRKPEIQGSYVICHKTKKGNNYGSGEFGIDYCPKFISATGETQYAILNYKEGIRTVSLLKSWADKQVYPLKANDTLGYTGNGQTAGGADQFRACKYTAASSGTISEVTWRGSITSGTGHIRIALYTDNAGKPGSLVANSDSGSQTVSHTTVADTIYSISPGGSITNGNAYWIAWSCDTANILVYCFEGGGTSAFAIDSYANFPRATAPSTSYGVNRYTVYYTYTAEEAAPRRRIILISKNETNNNHGIFVRGYSRHPSMLCLLPNRQRYLKNN